MPNPRARGPRGRQIINLAPGLDGPVQVSAAQITGNPQPIASPGAAAIPRLNFDKKTSGDFNGPLGVKAPRRFSGIRRSKPLVRDRGRITSQVKEKYQYLQLDPKFQSNIKAFNSELNKDLSDLGVSIHGNITDVIAETFADIVLDSPVYTGFYRSRHKITVSESDLTNVVEKPKGSSKGSLEEDPQTTISAGLQELDQNLQFILGSTDDSLGRAVASRFTPGSALASTISFAKDVNDIYIYNDSEYHNSLEFGNEEVNGRYLYTLATELINQRLQERFGKETTVAALALEYRNRKSINKAQAGRLAKRSLFRGGIGESSEERARGIKARNAEIRRSNRLAAGFRD